MDTSHGVPDLHFPIVTGADKQGLLMYPIIPLHLIGLLLKELKMPDRLEMIFVSP